MRSVIIGMIAANLIVVKTVWKVICFILISRIANIGLLAKSKTVFFYLTKNLFHDIISLQLKIFKFTMGGG